MLYQSSFSSIFLIVKQQSIEEILNDKRKRKHFHNGLCLHAKVYTHLFICGSALSDQLKKILFCQFEGKILSF